MDIIRRNPPLNPSAKPPLNPSAKPPAKPPQCREKKMLFTKLKKNNDQIPIATEIDAPPSKDVPIASYIGQAEEPEVVKTSYTLNIFDYYSVETNQFDFSMIGSALCGLGPLEIQIEDKTNIEGVYYQCNIRPLLDYLLESKLVISYLSLRSCNIAAPPGFSRRQNMLKINTRTGYFVGDILSDFEGLRHLDLSGLNGCCPDTMDIAGIVNNLHPKTKKSLVSLDLSNTILFNTADWDLSQFENLKEINLKCMIDEGGYSHNIHSYQNDMAPHLGQASRPGYVGLLETLTETQKGQIIAMNLAGLRINSFEALKETLRTFPNLKVLVLSMMHSGASEYNSSKAREHACMQITREYQTSPNWMTEPVTFVSLDD